MHAELSLLEIVALVRRRAALTALSGLLCAGALLMLWPFLPKTYGHRAIIQVPVNGRRLLSDTVRYLTFRYPRRPGGLFVRTPYVKDLDYETHSELILLTVRAPSHAEAGAYCTSIVEDLQSFFAPQLEQTRSTLEEESALLAAKAKATLDAVRALEALGADGTAEGLAQKREWEAEMMDTQIERAKAIRGTNPMFLRNVSIIGQKDLPSIYSRPWLFALLAALAGSGFTVLALVIQTERRRSRTARERGEQSGET